MYAYSDALWFAAKKKCRNLFKDGKPRNWKAGAVIIFIWIILIRVLVSKVFSFELSLNNTALKFLLLFTGSFLAAAISGAAGFGGALLLLPLLSRTIGTTLAVPVLTLAQLIGNLSFIEPAASSLYCKRSGYSNSIAYCKNYGLSEVYWNWYKGSIHWLVYGGCYDSRNMGWKENYREYVKRKVCPVCWSAFMPCRTADDYFRLNTDKV